MVELKMPCTNLTEANRKEKGMILGHRTCCRSFHWRFISHIHQDLWSRWAIEYPVVSLINDVVSA